MVISLLLPAAVHAAGTDTVAIEGQIVNGTAGGSVVTGLKVELRTYQNYEMVKTVTINAGADNDFSFTGLSADTTDSYEAVTTFKDVTYSSGLLQFATGEIAKKITLNVYETTSSDASIRIAMAHTVIYSQANGLSVKEVMYFVNSGDKTYTGSSGAGTSGQYETLKFSLPADATSFHPVLGFVDGKFVGTDHGFIGTMPVIPGDTQVSYTYQLPYSGAYQYSRNTDYPLDSLDIMVQAGDIKLARQRFVAADALNINGIDFNHYYGEAFLAGDAITFQLSNTPTRSSTFVIVIVLVLVLLILAFAIVFLVRRKGGIKFKTFREKTIGKLLSKLTDSDDDNLADNEPSLPVASGVKKKPVK